MLAFGGSYSGATCAWMRQRWPSKVAGCVSASGGYTRGAHPTQEVAISKAVTRASEGELDAGSRRGA